MQTRRDQLQAYRFVIRRVMAALLHGEPDSPESPMRKLAVATFSGVMVAVLGVAGFGVWGLLRPGGAQSVEDPGVLLIEKETGSRYVYNGNDHKLYPVLNYTSARLLLDSDEITVRRVSHESLSKFARGDMLGIPGAPDSLPDAEDLIRRPWAVCNRTEPSASGIPRQIVSLLVGKDPQGRPFGDDEFVVVQAAGQSWVIWHNLRLRASDTAVRVLPTQKQLTVGITWLNAVPVGPDFAPPEIPGVGTTANYQVNGTAPRVGQVFENDIIGGEPKWYVALGDGLAPITHTEALLLLNDTDNIAKAYGGRQPDAIEKINAAAASTIPQSRTSVSNSQLPSDLPDAATLPDGDDTPLCVSYPDPKGQPTTVRVTHGGNVPKVGDQQDSTIPIGAVVNSQAVDQVVLPNGGGALIGQVPSSDQPTLMETYYLLIDGLKFPLKSPDLVAKLGYQTSAAVPLPSNLVRLIPEGPLLDPALARRPVQVVPQLPGGSATPTAPSR